MQSQVQIISVTTNSRTSQAKDGKPARNYVLQEVQGIILGPNPQVFKHPFFFFDGETPHAVEAGKSYELEVSLNVNREAQLDPRITSFKPITKNQPSASA